MKNMFRHPSQVAGNPAPPPRLPDLSKEAPGAQHAAVTDKLLLWNVFLEDIMKWLLVCEHRLALWESLSLASTQMRSP